MGVAMIIILPAAVRHLVNDVRQDDDRRRFSCSYCANTRTVLLVRDTLGPLRSRFGRRCRPFPGSTRASEDPRPGTPDTPARAVPSRTPRTDGRTRGTRTRRGAFCLF